ncbi:DNA alkylation repair protein [Streptomyces sp. AK02-01A]|uniref:DNA alkylation repair protein n=1 Tax=Streptomyces sp. AK02-01A TaxID=3028648 RepID=UPI0029B5C433|nr:DNA alkylation repair protein [Streptomyces sp. AK02-01A]MDX3853965.1 DNA alkylation repair protein [Streptomyces sp. AK02-01A]
MPTADELLGRGVALRLIETVGRAAPGRELRSLNDAADALEGLSLRERSDLLADALLKDLPEDYWALDRIFRSALDDELFTGWLIWPVTEASVRAALSDGSTTTSFDGALDLLADLTPRLTGEFAIRRLLETDLPRALPRVRAWTRHTDAHVRRLASEGTRPHLPWAKKVKAILAAPESTIPILDALYRDSSEYVRRSVANHLNDISRNEPDLVVATAARWLENPDAHTQWVVRHGLRTLVKRAHPGALALQGYLPAPLVTVTGPVLAMTTVAVGEELAFEVTLTNTGAEAAALAVDYLVHHMKANGALRPKVFKLATRTLEPGQSVTIARRHSFKKISTRTYYAGEHAIEIQVNGSVAGRSPFRLVLDA